MIYVITPTKEILVSTITEAEDMIKVLIDTGEDAKEITVKEHSEQNN